MKEMAKTVQLNELIASTMADEKQHSISKRDECNEEGRAVGSHHTK